MTKQRRGKWPPGPRGIGRGFAPAVNGSLALTFPFARGNPRAAREAIVMAMQAAGCADTWRTLYRHGWRIVPVTFRIAAQRDRP